MHHEKTAHAAKGKWRGILTALGVPPQFLKNTHGPCPLCGGTDRFRWDNKEGQGSYICGQCGAGGGMDLAMKYTGKSFRDLATEIDALLGNVNPDSAASIRTLTDDEKRKALRSVWQITAPLAEGDMAHKYLTARGVGEKVYPAALRYGAAVKDGEGGVRPCMVAVVSDAGGKPCTLHRTFLRPDGGDKAEMAAPRKLMPGGVPDGAAIRLGDQIDGGCLGIAEGIETALAASAMFEMPVWSAINATIMAKWQPPDGITEVAIFGDNDRKFGGQAAAYQLAHCLAKRGMSVTVHIPALSGSDWLDEYQQKKGRK